MLECSLLAHEGHHCACDMSGIKASLRQLSFLRAMLQVPARKHSQWAQLLDKHWFKQNAARWIVLEAVCVSKSCWPARVDAAPFCTEKARSTVSISPHSFCMLFCTR